MKKKAFQSKSLLHPRNKHRNPYNFEQLSVLHPQLEAFVKPNKYGNQSINFFDPDAVKHLNISLLKYFYKIDFWNFPDGYLCPPIPGRVDYIHYLADLLEENLNNSNIRCLDIGTGASCIYPLLGVKEYGWNFVATDIDPKALSSAQIIINKNALQNKIELRLQKNQKNIFNGIIKANEHYDFAMCNPPFHASQAEASSANKRKVSNLTKSKNQKYALNFGGKNNELWCEGGELGFIQQMILESLSYQKSVHWFSTLVSKEKNLAKIYMQLKKIGAKEIKTIPMGQGNKKSRIVAWSFKY